MKINVNKVIELYKQYNNYFDVTTRLCPAGVTRQEWLAFYHKVIDIIKENNL